MEEWMGVKEIASLAEVTEQAVYKRIKSPEFSNLVKQVGKRRLLHISAVDLFKGNNNNQHSTENNQHYSNPQPTSLEVEMLEMMKKNIELLQKQLEVKDKQIEIKDKQIQDLNESLQQALQINSQSNYLMAQEKQKVLDAPLEERKGSWFSKLFKSKE